MDQVLDKHRERIVKSSYSKTIRITEKKFCPISYIIVACYISNYVSLSCSPQAIFKDPFRGGNNILVSTSWGAAA